MSEKAKEWFILLIVLVVFVFYCTCRIGEQDTNAFPLLGALIGIGLARLKRSR